jgi:hypothetical protein
MYSNLFDSKYFKYSRLMFFYSNEIGAAFAYGTCTSAYADSSAAYGYTESKKEEIISIDIKLIAFSVSQVTGTSGIGSGGACCGACAADTDATRRSALCTVGSRFTLSCPAFLFGLEMDA